MLDNMQRNATQENEYTLDFLRVNDANFSGYMIEYIKAKFADILDGEDQELLLNGDAQSLKKLSDKYRMKLEQRREQ